ncbi:hypothetical protein [Nocardia nova]|nr:hypothetical protein [Nocardia nova]
MTSIHHCSRPLGSGQWTIARILDLEDANTALRDTNAALTAERDELRGRADS